MSDFAIKHGAFPVLIEFSVANFRSIKERQTFSMVASKSKELVDTHTFNASLAMGGSVIRLLRSAAIYGANAAGKTNLLLAIQAMEEIVVKSASEHNRGVLLPVMPFMLDAKTRNSPSEFELHFIVENVRYQYGFSATKKRIMEEWLIAYPHNRAQRWFDRKWLSGSQGYQWEFGAFLSGEKNIWKKATRNNALFLSVAVQLNSQQLRPLYDWFSESMFLSGTQRWNSSLNFPSDDEEVKRKVLDFLKAADSGIDDLILRKVNLEENGFLKDLPEQIKQTIFKTMEDEKIYKTAAIHLDTDSKPIELDFDIESSGTKKIFYYSSYWIDALEKGCVVFIDEFSDRLHFELVKFLIKLFSSDQTNPYNAQLILTTHETSLLNQKLVRRDQIWFCEKNENGATEVYPLTDFRPRKGRENLEQGYLSGVYGALPYIRET